MRRVQDSGPVSLTLDFNLKYAHYVYGFRFNLLSVSKLIGIKNDTMKFGSSSFVLLDLKSSTMIGGSPGKQNLYFFNDASQPGRRSSAFCVLFPCGSVNMAILPSSLQKLEPTLFCVHY